MHVTTGTIGDLHSIDQLSVRKWRESNNIHGLSQTASKERGTVYAWQNTNLRTEWTNFVQFTTIWANRFFNNGTADLMMNRKLKGIMISRLKISSIVSDFFFIIFTLTKLERKFGIHLSTEFIGDTLTIKYVTTNLSAEFTIFADEVNLSPGINFFLNGWIWQG